MSGISKKIPLPFYAALMDKCGWKNPTELARAANIAPDTAHRVVYGEVQPSLKTVLSIATAAKISAEDIALEVFRYTQEYQQATSNI